MKIVLDGDNVGHGFECCVTKDYALTSELMIFRGLKLVKLSRNFCVKMLGCTLLSSQDGLCKNVKSPRGVLLQSS